MLLVLGKTIFSQNWLHIPLFSPEVAMDSILLPQKSPPRVRITVPRNVTEEFMNHVANEIHHLNACVQSRDNVLELQLHEVKQA